MCQAVSHKIYHYFVVNTYSTPLLKFRLHLIAIEKLLHCFEVGSFYIVLDFIVF